MSWLIAINSSKLNSKLNCISSSICDEIDAFLVLVVVFVVWFPLFQTKYDSSHCWKLRISYTFHSCKTNFHYSMLICFWILSTVIFLHTTNSSGVQLGSDRDLFKLSRLMCLELLFFIGKFAKVFFLNFYWSRCFRF